MAVSYYAQIQGIYVDKFIGAHPGTPAALDNILIDVFTVGGRCDQLLQFCKVNGIRHLSLYDTGRVGDMTLGNEGLVNSRNDETLNAAGKNYMSAFVVKARRDYGMLEISPVGNFWRVNATRYDGTIEYRRWADYNNTRVDAKEHVQYCNVETEFWNWDDAEINLAQPGTLTISNASRDVTGSGTNFNALAGIDPDGTQIGGWIKVNGEFRQIAEVVSATLLRVDRPFSSSGSGFTWDYGWQISGGSKTYFVDFATFLHRAKAVSTYLRANGLKLEGYFGFADPNELKQLRPYFDRMMLHAYRYKPTYAINVRNRVRAIADYCTGTISSSGTTVTGVGTLALTELAVGCRIKANGEIRTITGISSDLSFTVNAPFTVPLSADQFGVYVDVMWIYSAESIQFPEECGTIGSCTPDASRDFSGNWLEGKTSGGVPTGFPAVNQGELYGLVSVSGYVDSAGNAAVAPTFEDETDVDVQDNINLVGQIVFDQHLLRQLAFNDVVYGAEDLTIVVAANADTCGTGNGSISIVFVPPIFGGSTNVEYFLYSVDVNLNRVFVSSQLKLTSHGAFSFTGLSAGRYELIAIDNFGRTTYEFYDITSNPPVLAGFDNYVQVTCNGGSDGSVDITPSGGTNDYYLIQVWNSSSTLLGIFPVLAGSSYTLSGLYADSYTVQIIDGISNCQSSVFNFTINQPTAVTFNTTKTDSSCGTSNGSITIVTPAGGSGSGYQYSINNGVSWSGSSTFNGLAAGSYQVRVRDGSGCVSAPATVVVNTTNPPTVVISGDTDVCEDEEFNLTATASGGSGAGYTYAWSTGDTTQSIVVVPPHGGSSVTVTCIVTDSNGCQGTDTHVVTISPKTVGLKPLIVVSGTVNACGNSVLTFSVSNAASFDGILWYDGSGGNSITKTLTPGDFPLTVYCYGDLGVCTYRSDNEIVSAGTPPSISGSVTNVLCYGANDGAIALTITDGIAPFNYQWTGPNGFTSTSKDITGLAPGVYTVQVSDSGGCIVSQSFTVTENTRVEPNLVVVQPTCGGQPGTATVSPSGGAGPYTVNWSNGDTGNSVQLNYGTYTVTVTDNSGCSRTQQFTINNIQPAIVTGISRQPTALGINDGWIRAIVTGGSGYFNYSWNTNPIQNTVVARNLGPGTFTVTVTDRFGGCQYTATFVLLATKSDEETETEIWEHRVGCCVSSLMAKAAFLERVGGTEYECLYKKAMQAKALWKIYCLNSKSQDSNCLTEEEVAHIKELLEQYCNGCADC